MNKTVVVTGATGFVGKKLTVELLKRGYDVRVFSRNIKHARSVLHLPVAFHDAISPELFENTFAVIHLAGEPIAARRWNAETKDKILRSRSDSTKALIEAIHQSKNPPQILVGASAIGIYGDRDDDHLDESSSFGEGFLARVCKEWEKAYSGFSGRTVLLRTGIVLGHGGALEKMLPPFRMGLGGKLAGGKQWMSWIHIEDLIRMYIWSMETGSVRGSFNAVAPGPVRNSEFTQTLSKVLERPALFPVPALALKLMFGEMSSVLLGSQQVSAIKIISNGFQFTYRELHAALTELLRPLGVPGAYVFEDYHWLSEGPEKIFPFFGEAKNLETITPPWLNFHIHQTSSEEITSGTIIDYKLKIKGVPVRWKTLISQWEPGTLFVDEQLKGPYKLWHHTHAFTPMKGGTLMSDRVVYQVPFGPIGNIVREIMIARDVKMIFSYRASEINRKFPPASGGRIPSESSQGLPSGIETSSL